MVDSGEVTVVVVAAAAAVVAQSVNRPKLRFLKEVQLTRRKFDSFHGIEVRENNPSFAICGIVRQNTCAQT